LRNLRNLSGVVRLPEPCRLRKPNVTVQVVDASIMDATPAILAETRFESAAAGRREIPFVLNAPADGLAGRDIRIIARVMARSRGNIAPGDYLTMESVRFAPDEQSGRPLEVPVSRVKDPDQSVE
jgi:hypothetical protein